MLRCCCGLVVYVGFAVQPVVQQIGCITLLQEVEIVEFGLQRVMRLIGTLGGQWMLLLLLFDARHDVTKWRRHAVEFFLQRR